MPHGTVEVRFQDLTIKAPIGVGSSGLPTLINSYTNLFFVGPNAPFVTPSGHLSAAL